MLPGQDGLSTVPLPPRLGAQQRIEVARCFEVVISSFSFGELGRTARSGTNRGAAWGALCAGAVLDLLPEEMRMLIPPGAGEAYPPSSLLCSSKSAGSSTRT